MFDRRILLSSVASVLGIAGLRWLNSPAKAAEKFEIEKTDGVMWEFPQFVEHVADLLRGEDSVIEPLLAKARHLRGGDLLADDFSLLEAWL